ncbi:alpha/beta fold hydrolase [Dinoroseobacter sp. S124A]|uniref:alpha/beta fold hydrolase n=1 Tax=Dinoroseobacter sp. S124A TaxID=3415128 RepID=UPI003C7C5C8A
MREPLVFLPGMMCDARLFAPQIADLSHARPILVAPLIGADSMAALAASVLKIAPPRFALAGLSMGGIVAMEVIRQAPERVTRLALLDTNPKADPPGKAPDRAAQVARVLDGGLLQVMREEVMPYYIASDDPTDPILDLCQSMAEDLGPQVFAAQSHAVQTRPDQQESLGRVQVPTLVLCGAEDRMCPPARHELMRDLIPGARLAQIPEAGHLPTLETPEAVTRELAQWLNV